MNRLKEVLNLIENNGAICIYGESGTGKTTLLRNLETHLENTVYLQLQGIQTLDEFVKYLADKINKKFNLSVSNKSLFELGRSLRKLNFQLTILLDEFETFNDNPIEFNRVYGSLKAWSEMGKHRVVTASLTLNDNLVFNNCAILPIKKDECR